MHSVLTATRRAATGAPPGAGSARPGAAQRSAGDSQLNISNRKGIFINGSRAGGGRGGRNEGGHGRSRTRGWRPLPGHGRGGSGMGAPPLTRPPATGPRQDGARPSSPPCLVPSARQGAAGPARSAARCQAVPETRSGNREAKEKNPSPPAPQRGAATTTRLQRRHQRGEQAASASSPPRSHAGDSRDAATATVLTVLSCAPIAALQTERWPRPANQRPASTPHHPAARRSANPRGPPGGAAAPLWQRAGRRPEGWARRGRPWAPSVPPGRGGQPRPPQLQSVLFPTAPTGGDRATKPGWGGWNLCEKKTGHVLRTRFCLIPLCVYF